MFACTHAVEREREKTWENAFENHCGEILFLFRLFFSRTKPKRLNSFFLSFQIFLLKSVVPSPCAILNWAQVAPHTPPRLSKRRINDNNGREKKLLKRDFMTSSSSYFLVWWMEIFQPSVQRSRCLFLLSFDSFFSNSESLTHRGTMRQCGLSLFSSLFFRFNQERRDGKKSGLLLVRIILFDSAVVQSFPAERGWTG